jgi:hypothetical protein
MTKTTIIIPARVGSKKLKTKIQNESKLFSYINEFLYSHWIP